MALISNVRVGIAVRVIEGLSLDVIGELLNDAQPATLMLHAGEDKMCIRDRRGRCSAP